MKDFARSVFTKDEDELVRLLDSYDARYVVLDHRNYSLKDFYLNLLKNEADFRKYKKDADDLPFIFFNNLLFFDGELRWRGTPAVEHFRLVYEVPKTVSVPLKSAKGAFKHQFNGLKIFERVSGADIVLKNLPKNVRVVIRLPLKTNTGREFAYTNYAETGDDGVARFTVPYPSVPIPGSAVRPTESSYGAWIGDLKIREFSVTEAAAEGEKGVGRSVREAEAEARVAERPLGEPVAG